MHYWEPIAQKKANVFGNYVLFPALMSESMRKPWLLLISMGCSSEDADLATWWGNKNCFHIYLTCIYTCTRKGQPHPACKWMTRENRQDYLTQGTRAPQNASDPQHLSLWLHLPLGQTARAGHKYSGILSPQNRSWFMLFCLSSCLLLLTGGPRTRHWVKHCSNLFL